MQNEDLILQLLREINDGQKSLVTKVNELAMDQQQLKADIAAGRNGYEPHEIVDLLHWVERKMKEDEKTYQVFLESFLRWFFPALGAAVLMGVAFLHK